VSVTDNEPAHQSGLYHYSDAHLHTMINIVGTVVSSLTPMVSIVVLYVVQSTSIRLGLICAFTLIFSFLLSLDTKARRVEIFEETEECWAMSNW
jgi:prepilin signal peptidase PulO-like enzyme (type II secretory pathway)